MSIKWLGHAQGVAYSNRAKVYRLDLKDGSLIWQSEPPIEPAHRSFTAAGPLGAPDALEPAPNHDLSWHSLWESCGKGVRISTSSAVKNLIHSAARHTFQDTPERKEANCPKRQFQCYQCC
eukprot:4649981-Amphidinium_carterae.1